MVEIVLWELITVRLTSHHVTRPCNNTSRNTKLSFTFPLRLLGLFTLLLFVVSVIRHPSTFVSSSSLASFFFLNTFPQSSFNSSLLFHTITWPPTILDMTLKNNRKNNGLFPLNLIHFNRAIFPCKMKTEVINLQTNVFNLRVQLVHEDFQNYFGFI